MENDPTQLTKATHWTKKWAGTLPTLYIKEKEKASKHVTKSKKFIITSAIFQ